MTTIVLDKQCLREFDTLRGYHLGVLKVGWYISENGYISGFGRFAGEAGNGAKAMRHICHLADRWHIPLTLIPDHSEGNKLITFYSRFRFVFIEYSNRMLRPPMPSKRPGLSANNAENMSFRRDCDPFFLRDPYMEARRRHFNAHLRKS